jgi:hypothetical protein
VRPGSRSAPPRSGPEAQRPFGAAAWPAPTCSPDAQQPFGLGAGKASEGALRMPGQQLWSGRRFRQEHRVGQADQRVTGYDEARLPRARDGAIELCRADMLDRLRQK